MALFVEVRNTNPLGAVAIAIQGEQLTVEKGGVIEVPPEVAGRAPRWRKATDDDAADVAAGRVHSRERAGSLEVFDVGEGMLAQSDNWVDAGQPKDAPKPDPLAPGHPVPADTSTGTETS